MPVVLCCALNTCTVSTRSARVSSGQHAVSARLVLRFEHLQAVFVFVFAFVLSGDARRRLSASQYVARAGIATRARWHGTAGFCAPLYTSLAGTLQTHAPNAAQSLFLLTSPYVPCPTFISTLNWSTSPDSQARA